MKKQLQKSTWEIKSPKQSNIRIKKSLAFMAGLFLVIGSFAQSTPELLYYKFDGSGTTVPNMASAPPVGTTNATIMGGVTQGGSSGQCQGALIGSGISASSDYLNTGYATSLSGSWTISMWTSNITASTTLFYIFGDGTAGSFRCFTNGVAGANNWILRGPLTDVLVNGGATVAPHVTTFVYDAVAGNIKAYLDGVLVNTVAQAAITLSGTGPFKVMGYNTNVGAPVGGLLDEFRMYNRALTATEVADLLTIDAVVTTDPSNQTVCAGVNTSFSITANDATGYQWEVSTNGGTSYTTATGGIYSNETTATLNLTSPAASDNGNMYRCIALSTCGSNDTSAAVTLTVNALPVIGLEPVAIEVCPGDNGSFTITATGTNITYQWEVSTNGGASYTSATGGIYSNETTNTLNITAPTSAENGNIYRCIVSGTCSPNDTSAAAMLTINSLPLVTVDANDVTICEGINASFSITATGTGLTYQWEVSTNGGASYTSATGGIYSNETTATLDITGATAAENGNMYQCVVTGTCSPVVTSAAKTLTVNTSPVIAMEASDSTICEGNDASFSISATGTGLTYQWEVSTNGGGSYTSAKGGIYSNETTATLTITGATAAENGNMYQCIVTGT